MFKSMKIPRKLGLSFLAICASAAVVMIVFFLNITMISTTTDGNNLSQSIHARSIALETAILRQNSQLRGYLVTADKSYLKSYYEGRDEYDKTSVELENLLPRPRERDLLLQSRTETLAWRKNWGDRLIERVKAGQREAAEEEVRNAGKAVLVSAAVLPLRDIRDAEVALIEQNSARQEGAIATARVTLIVGAIGLIGIAITLAMLLSRSIARPVAELTRTMGELAAGRNDIAVPDAERRDELGDMARAVIVFRDAAIAKQAAEAETARSDAAQRMVVEAVSTHLSELADGNLTAEIEREFPGSYATVKTNFNAAITSLRTLIASVTEATATIHTGSNEIADASEDLARRTEANAASLEETSAAVAQMDERLKATATAATQTVDRANGAIETVSKGRDVAEGAVQAMNRVSESAKGIDSVIEGLDKIAFQTRVLAMNAAVEAGRAGEAGRGFAVVADLVSALAMRAEEQAGQAREQLTATQTDIVDAVTMVQKVDAALANISGDVGEVHALLGRIAEDNRAQSSTIGEVSTAIGTMDHATQQNAAMVEQTSAAARNLASEVTGLAEQAKRFNVGHVAKRMAAPAHGDRFAGPVRSLPPAAIPALVRPAASPDEWQPF
ncbi:methyl-accepting chemotaxis protein [Sphingomonas cavernae]|uniref:HAMP domain-containing protein n=1 Tax=Sphingomonas cavernae TaxID=2320861 RepID=A0A418WQY2_9SPHN|nr:methyl-accepting chemotaxis protein [Sphingomonas cavernae]RJF93665.1 HAMP domain-containing protein [Sphingomonas cavernae]